MPNADLVKQLHLKAIIPVAQTSARNVVGIAPLVLRSNLLCNIQWYLKSFRLYLHSTSVHPLLLGVWSK